MGQWLEVLGLQGYEALSVKQIEPVSDPPLIGVYIVCQHGGSILELGHILLHDGCKFVCNLNRPINQLTAQKNVDSSS